MERLSKLLILLTPIVLIPIASAQSRPEYAPITAVFARDTVADMVEPAYAAPAGRRELSPRDAEGYRAWKRSLIPVAVSQSLDVASSYGMRELNPMLAGSDGRFGMRAVAIKGGAMAGIVGIEYLIVKKWPGSARVLSKLNWSSSILTTTFAVHNFAIK